MNAAHTLHLALPQFQSFSILLVRIAGIISVFPILNTLTIPMPVKAGLVTMLGLVLAGNIFLVFVFWELVGVSTYEIGGGAVINGLGGERYRVHFRHSFKRPARQRCPACAGLVVMAGGNCNACGATVEPHPSFARIQGLVKKEEIVMSQERLVALYGITFKWNLYHWNSRRFYNLHTGCGRPAMRWGKWSCYF